MPKERFGAEKHRVGWDPTPEELEHLPAELRDDWRMPSEGLFSKKNPGGAKIDALNEIEELHQRRVAALKKMRARKMDEKAPSVSSDEGTPPEPSEVSDVVPDEPVA